MSRIDSGCITSLAFDVASSVSLCSRLGCGCGDSGVRGPCRSPCEPVRLRFLPLGVLSCCCGVDRDILAVVLRLLVADDVAVGRLVVTHSALAREHNEHGRYESHYLYVRVTL